MSGTRVHTEIKFEVFGFSWDDGLMMWVREPSFGHLVFLEIPKMTANFKRRMAETGQTREELLAELNARVRK